MALEREQLRLRPSRRRSGRQIAPIEDVDGGVPGDDQLRGVRVEAEGAHQQPARG